MLDRGQKINLGKLRICFLANSSPTSESKMRVCVGDRRGASSIGKYLGFPMEMRPSNLRSFNFVAGRIKEKLGGWKASSLSMAGRITLINSVISTIPVHIMQCTLLPKGTCDAIDRLYRSFLWGSNGEKCKIHLVNWDSVSLPEELGGLGLARMGGRNMALTIRQSCMENKRGQCAMARLPRGHWVRRPPAKGSSFS